MLERVERVVDLLLTGGPDFVVRALTVKPIFASVSEISSRMSAKWSWGHWEVSALHGVL